MAGASESPGKTPQGGGGGQMTTPAAAAAAAARSRPASALPWTGLGGRAPLVIGQDGTRALMVRQYQGRALPAAACLPGQKALLAPLSYLTLDYASHKHAGRMDYNHSHSQPGAEPLLAIASTTNFSLTIWRHPVSVAFARPAKLLSFPGLHTAPITSIRWSPVPGQEAEILTTAEDGTVKLFHSQRREVLASLSLPANAPSFAATFLDAATLAVGYGRHVGLWDRRAPQLSLPGAGQQQQQMSQHPAGIVTDLAATLDAPLLYSSSVDGTVKVWDLRRGLGGSLSLATVAAYGDDGGVASLELHSGGTGLLVGCEGTTSYDLDLAQLPARAEWALDPTPGACPLVRCTYDAGVGATNRCNLKRAQRSQDGRYVVRGSDDASVSIWDASTGAILRRLTAEPATPLLGQAATRAPLLATALARTGPWPRLAFSTDLAAFLYSFRESPQGEPLPQPEDVDLLDDALAEEASLEEHGVYGDEGEAEGDEEAEDEPQAWERDRLNLQEGECSYGRGYVAQLVFVCETCLEQTQARAAAAAAAAGATPDAAAAAADAVHGICASCAAHCHEIVGHRVRPLGEKRSFRCDCGAASKFGTAGRGGRPRVCSLQREKDAANAGNAYNHNFVGDRWCYCDGAEVLPMVQCLSCRDWFHQEGCIHDGYDFTRDEFAQGEDYLCSDCLETPALAFLGQYPSKPLADRPAWQPLPLEQQQEQQQPAEGDEVNLNPGGGDQQHEQQQQAEAPGAPAAPAAAATSTEQGQEAEGEAQAGAQSDGDGACCALCHQPGRPQVNACIALLTCRGRPPPMAEEEDNEDEAAPPMEEGDDDRKMPAEEQQQEEGQEGACGKAFHRACLPRGAAGYRDEDGEWCCPACLDRAAGDEQKDGEEGEEDGHEVAPDPSLPQLGWRMQRGRFLEPGWESQLLEEHKALARRALDPDMPMQGVEGASAAAAAMAAASPSPGSAAAAATAAASAAPGPPQGEGQDFADRLIGKPLSEAEFEAEIKRAILAGDEARAFRLAMQRIMGQVAETSATTRRSIILPSDVERAAEALRGRSSASGSAAASQE